jgi:hypothetical protein
MAFDENNYKKIFESRYGAGSFDSGLADARKMGQLKAQAGIAKQQFDNYVSEQKKAQKAAATKAKKKTYTDALTYFNDPSVKESIKKDGAYKIANDIKNDPQKQADIKAQGYNLSDYIDAMYNAASDGQYRSQREYSQFSKDLTSSTKKDNAAKDKEYKDKYGMTYQDYYDTVQKPQQDAAKKTSKKKLELPAISSKKKQNTLWDDIKNPAKRVVQALNPFDNVSFSEALNKNFIDTANTKRSQPVKETTRALTRIGNVGTFGAVNEATKAVNNGTPFQEFQDRKGAGKVADTAYDLIGGAATIIPGAKFLEPLANAGARKILGTKAGQALEGLAASRGIHAGTAISSAIRGAGAMGAYGTIQQGIGEALNPNEATFGQRALNVGAQAAAGAVLDPALSSVGGTIANSKLGQTIMNMIRSKQQTAPSQELLGLPEPQLRLNAPQQALPAPRAVEPTVDTFNKVGTMPNGLQNPIPSMPKPMSEAITRNNLESQGLNFGLNTNRIKTRPLAPQESAQNPAYWQGRYEDFVKYVQDQGYHSDNLNHEAIQELWTHFAKYDEPVNIDQVVDLAYPKGYQAPEQQLQSGLDSFRQAEQKPLEMNPKQLPTNQDLTIKDYLNQDPRIKQKIQEMYPPQRPEQPISRPATFDEMYQRMQETAPPKQQATPLEPLQFRREKGFNPDLLPKIKNRTVEQPLNEKKSLLLPLKPVNLKSLKTDKSVHTMNKAELQGVYKELQAKKTALSSTSTTLNAKAIKNVEADMKQVEGLLMKLDLQLFGKSEPKPVVPKLKAGSESVQTSQPTAEKITPAKAPVKDPKKEYAIAQSKNKKLVETYKQKNDKLKEEVAKLLSNSDQWKDKGRFQLGRETMNRNFEDIMGKDANTFKQKFLDPISSQEANRVRFLNKEREIVKTYGIKAKSEDDKLVQMYGEKKISLADLKQKTQNWKQVVKVAENYRKKYDELLTTVNKELENNGFNPIPKRADYFPHYEEVDGLMKSLGFDMENHSLPTDINGLTDQFKPNKNFFRNALQRKGDETTFGAIQGFDKYIEGISNVIYHTKNIKQLRSLDQVIRTKYAGDTKLSNFAAELTEYTNLLAGKKAKVDRAFEDRFGRKVYNAVETIRRRTGANMIGANVSSALTNFIPITQSLATTEKKAFVKGLSDTLANVVKNDGFVQQSDFLTKRIGSDPLYRTNWDKITDKSMWLMKTFDSFTSQAVTRGKYNELIGKGLSHEKAIKQADDYAARLMADRSKGSMPTLFNSKTFGVLSQFQLEVNNQVSFLFKDLPRNSKNKAALASSMGQILLYSYLYNNLYEKAVGRRPAFDPIGIAFQAKKDYTNDNLSKGEATQNLTKNVLNTLPFTSIMSGGRFPIAAGVPNTNDAMAGRSSWTTELSKPLIYLGLPAGGGQLKKTYEGLTDMNKNPLEPQGTTGSYKNGKLQYPVEDSAANNARAALFGKYSLPESNQFYDNKRTSLSDKQTKMVEQNPEMYQNILMKQQLASIKNKIKEIQKDDSLTQEQKQKKLLPLFQQLQGR